MTAISGAKLWLGLGALAVAFAVGNATLFIDDAYLALYFGQISGQRGFFENLPTLLLNADMVAEYRLYAFSRLLHFTLWQVFGADPRPYAAVIAASQVAAGAAATRLLQDRGVERFQAQAVGFVAATSMFAVTTCFHYYSYLILPYQLVLVCALLFRLRALSALVGGLIALTGEAHLGAACLALTVLSASDLRRSRRQRLVDAAVPIVAIVLTVVAHRLTWLHVVPPTAQMRYRPELQSLPMLLRHSLAWLKSLLPGAGVQLRDVAIGVSALPLAGITAAVLAAAWWLRRSLTPPDGAQSGVAVFGWLAAVCAASLAVYGTLAVATGLVGGVFERRYGLTPLTLALMALAALAAAPAVRRRSGAFPGLAVCSLALGFWLLLQAVALPTVRRQDRQVWSEIANALAAKPGSGLLFVRAAEWEVTRQYPIAHILSVSLRGRGFPPVLESTLSGFWPQSLYAAAVLKAPFVGYRWTELDADRVDIGGTGMFSPVSSVVAKDAVVVVFDPRLDVSPRSDPRGVTVFRDWSAFVATNALPPS